MAITTGLASRSETLWTASTGTYMLAVVAYTGEYAFGRNGRIASTSSVAERSLVAERSPVAEPALVRAPALVGAGGAGDEQRPGGGGRVVSTPDAGQRWGRWAVLLTILGA